MAEEQAQEAEQKAGKPIVKIAIMVVLALVLIGAGVVGTLVLTGAFSSHAAPAEDEEDATSHGPAPAAGHGAAPAAGHGAAPAKDAGGHGGGGHGAADKKDAHGAAKPAAAASPQKRPLPADAGARFEKTYMDLDDKKALVANVYGSRKVMQVSLSLMTQYDDRVFKNVETHRAALRSASLDVLRTVTEPDLSKPEFRIQLAGRLRDRINMELERLEGFGGIEEVFFTEFVYQ